ncbi:capsular biosynthesis protein [Grimontia sp. AD028]|uniref:glycosyltransferase family 2 protein n=1 Tax=Grimontia sp. AD028 TaxID=1581149 RepID=UPI00061A8F46|nr:glycosyltransferase family 2 protein [Grimontia sp. AD028]KKD61493.1 capsular biosynthesis protein [Grimontia sp. AD028]
MIVIPMAGLSSRFFKAGYKEPKYMLEAKGITVFEHAVKSFERYFKSEPFLFIVRDVFDTPKFVSEKAKSLGIKTCHVVALESETRGQAETVFQGLKDSSDAAEPITIFNIDTFRPGFQFPAALLPSKDCYLEVFQGSGDNWSFVLPKSNTSTEVTETAEKRPISDLCCTGLYHFASAADFLEAYNFYSEREELWEKGELYVAPLYNHLIQQGKSVHYHLIPREDVIFCGVPDEYEAFKND